jgi:hypothetical protein
VLGLGGADDGAHAAGPTLPQQPAGEAVDQLRQALVQGSVGGRQILDVRGAGVAGADQGEDSGSGRRRRRDQRLQGVRSQQRVGGEGIGAEPGDGAPRGRRLADQRLGVGGGGDGDVAALAVGDDQQAGLPGGIAGLLQRCPTGGAEALEAGELGLDSDAGGSCSLDEASTVGRYGGGGELGGRTAVACLRPLPGQLGRVGVEAEADLTATLRYQRRQPIGELRQSCLSRP